MTVYKPDHVFHTPPIMSENTSSFNPVPVAVIAGLFILIMVFFFGDWNSPANVTKERLSRLEQVVTDYVAEHERAPDSLEQLGLSDDALRDHLDEPFIYSVSNNTVTITSYGSDKNPGGHFYKRDHIATINLPR